MKPHPDQEDLEDLIERIDRAKQLDAQGKLTCEERDQLLAEIAARAASVRQEKP